MQGGSRMNTILVVLRVIAVMMAITGAVGLGWASTKEYRISTDGLGISYDRMGYVTFAISGFWCLIALGLHFTLKDSVHPGVYTGVEVTLFAYVLAIGLLNAASPILDIDHLTCSNRHFGLTCDQEEDNVEIFRVVACAFLLFNSLVHLAAFVPAVISCHKLRKEKKGKVNDIEMK